MKTKLDLYLSAHAAAVASLELKPAAVEAHAKKAIAEAKLAAGQVQYWNTIFFGRRQNLLELAGEPAES